MWRCHNEEVHGPGKYSRRDVVCLRKCVEEIYEKMRSQVSPEDEWLFTKSVKIRTEQSIPQVIGWLERVLLCFDEKICDESGIVAKASQVLRRMSVATIYV